MRKNKRLIRTGMAALLAAAMLIPQVSAYADAVSDEAERCSSFELGDGKKGALFLAFHQAEDVIEPTVCDTLSPDYPETYDLRDYGVVTPVKNQAPFGTCWGFATIAAAETSILTASGQTYEETGLDLSEHHLTYFARTTLNDEKDSQFGEGCAMLDPTKNLFSTGGLFVTSTSILSSGIGPVYEELIPYRGRNSETQKVVMFMNVFYSDKDDWTLPDEYKFIQDFQLIDSNILKSPAVYSSDLGNDIEDPKIRAEYYLGNDMAAIDAIKSELMDGLAVCVAFGADTALPGQVPEDGSAKCIGETADGKWLHYTPDCRSINHAVTIVGWDDTIKRTDFFDHSNDEGGDGLPHQPEGDGAFIVKNSWGAQANEFPHNGSWGNITDGKHDGYFYLSYYDPTLSLPESFTFLPMETESSYIIDQYDYMPADDVKGWLADTELLMSNIFTAEVDENVDSVSCQTFVPNSKVTYQIYKLTPDSKSPADGSLEATIECEYEDSGYHRAFLPDPVFVEKGCTYSVVVNETYEHNGQTYHGLCTKKNMNQEGTAQCFEDYKKAHPDEKEEDLPILSYSIGIVNPGESFVYIDELSGWYDFSGMIETLGNNSGDTYAHDYDNFPIKAYCSFANEEDLSAFDQNTLPELNFAEPATVLDMGGLGKLLLLALGGLLLFIAIIIVTVKLIKRAVRKKKAEKASDAPHTEENKEEQ